MQESLRRSRGEPRAGDAGRREQPERRRSKSDVDDGCARAHGALRRVRRPYASPRDTVLRRVSFACDARSTGASRGFARGVVRREMRSRRL